jgi:hypothetical protein
MSLQASSVETLLATSQPAHKPGDQGRGLQPYGTAEALLSQTQVPKGSMEVRV